MWRSERSVLKKSGLSVDPCGTPLCIWSGVVKKSANGDTSNRFGMRTLIISINQNQAPVTSIYGYFQDG